MEHRVRVAPLITATYTFAGDTLAYKQGVRRILIPLAQVRAFAIRARPATFGLPNSQLVFRLETGALRRTVIDPETPDARALIEALRARLPAADATELAWPDAAAKLGVDAHPWYEALFHPRTMIGITLLAANSVAASGMEVPRDRDERLGQGIGLLVVSIVAIWLIVSGVRRTRARRRG
ncbi:MAG TPA: hypothetical protein VL463_15515 [Kofleriaceae bacterium]|jgi:hypothetical protein|nr:hypothetical protein [Kofleriaceae bacterium]